MTEEAVVSFTAEEFADYWEGQVEDAELGKKFMTRMVKIPSGIELLTKTVDMLAKRNGVSSKQVQTFRSTLREACKAAGIGDILTPRKVKGTGTKANPTPSMVLSVSKKQEEPEAWLKILSRRFDKWEKKDGVPVDDMRDAMLNWLSAHSV